MHQTETTNLDQLLTRLREEGVEAAQQESVQILTDAKQKAAQILSDAQEEAVKLLSKAEGEIQSFEDSTAIKLKQAARDVKLRLVEDLQKRLEKTIDFKVQQSMDSSFVQKIIQEIISAENFTAKVTKINLTAQDLESLGSGFLASLGDALTKDCKVQADKGLQAGFTLQLEGEDFYFEFSNQQIAKELANLVSPQLQSLFLED